METDPWKIINHLFPDLVFLVEGKKLYFHQAVVAQHSVLVKSLLLKNSCCKCFGVDCSRNAGNVFITLDGVKVDTVQYVMDMVYSGSGNIAGDTEDYKSVIDMLQIDTILVGVIEALDGFNMEEIVSEIGSETILFNAKQESSFNSDALDEESRKVDEQLRETNKALKKLEKEKKKLALEEKKKLEIQRKEDRRNRNKRPNYAEEDSRDGIKVGEEIVKPEESMEKDMNPVQMKHIPIDKKEAVSTNNLSKSESSSKSNSNDDECEIIALDDSVNEVKNTSMQEVTSEEIERYVCPFKDCRSESKNAQSIKVHLALVHYKKTIQSEFPNWKKQKCDECDKSFGQMTAYYLHMANHKKYQYMDLPAHAMKPKDDLKKVTVEKVIQPTPLKSTNSPAVRSSTPMSITRSSSPQVTPSTRTSGAIIKPASIMPARSNSFVQSRTVNQANKNSSFTAMRSKSFVQAKSQPQTPTTSKLQSLVMRTPSSSSSTGNSSAIFGRPAPPGPPGPPSRSSNVFSRSSGTVINSNTKNPANPSANHQRRLSAPYSVVHKRTSSVDRPAAKDTKKTRGS